MGKDRFQKITKHIFDTDYDADVYVTAEKFDPAIVVKQLQDLLFTYSRIPGTNLDVDAVMKEVLDIMGLSGSRFTRQMPVGGEAEQQQLVGAGVGGGQVREEVPTQRTEFQRANIEGTIGPRERR